jgi:galactokinase
MSLQEKVIQAFQARFDTSPDLVVRAPGRVNLIGEHTDYNDGFVLPMAIERAIWIALRPRDDGWVRVHSIDFGEGKSFSLAALQNASDGWVEYLKGTAWALQQAGQALRGWSGVLSGDVPLGAGLSSSAALEIATARAFAAVSDIPWEPRAMALLAQRAENEWIGMKCGIMDQMISASGEAGHALLIDCRSLETESVPLPPGSAVAILDTTTRRGLVDSAYNERREQCEAAARFFGVRALRDVSLETFESKAGGLDDVTRRRARHVITENNRTQRAAEAMRRGDPVEMGRLMDASHTSMRDDFEISGDALNAMVECARQEGCCYGARMTGGGFAGCAVALIRTDAADEFASAVADCYERQTGLTPAIYISHPAQGAEVLRVNPEASS